MNLNCKEEIILENDRALLRPLSLTDFDVLLPIAVADRTLLQYSPSPIYSPELLSAYIETALNAKAAENRYPFIIYDKQTQSYAGSSSFLNINNANKVVEIGHTWLGRQFQQTGLNRNCKSLLLNYAFNILQFERVELRTDERNSASRTAIEKIGGKFEGILRSHMIMSDGFRRNTVVYSILRQEWPNNLL